MRHLSILLTALALGLGTTALAQDAASDVAADSAATGGRESSESSSCCDQAICDSCGCSNDFAECCDSFNNRKRFLGFLPSDHCFDDFISPISNPFFFEDPRSLTEFRGIFLDNSLPAGKLAAVTHKFGQRSFAAVLLIAGALSPRASVTSR